MTTGHRRLLKAQAAGALLLASLFCLLTGAGTPFVPTRTALGALARIFESAAPWLLALAAGFAVAAAWLGLRRAGALLACAALAGAGHLAWDHARLSLPDVADRPSDLRVLFLNVRGGNAAQSHRIVAAALDHEPDVIVFAEARAIYPALPALRDAYDFVSPCELKACELLVASRRRPVRFWRLSLNPAWHNRYAVTELETRSGKRAFLVGNHLLKPWLVGLSEAELARLGSQYDWLSGPTVAVGDYNAAPWSRPMRELLEQTGYRTLRRPFPSWPAGAGWFGIPIDHVLVHNGARVVQIRAFGAGMGSNHRGFYVDIALP